MARILPWAGAHRVSTGRWPTAGSGPIRGAGGEDWSAVVGALRQGLRGLPGGNSLPRLLARRLGARVAGALPRLTEQDVLRWADAHCEAHGRWPHRASGAVGAAPGETWAAVNAALAQGGCGLPGGSSLARLLAERCQALNRFRPRLTEAGILAWADEHRSRTGGWPGSQSGPVAGQPGGDVVQDRSGALPAASRPAGRRHSAKMFSKCTATISIPPQ